MGRYSPGGRRTCESCNSLDVRYLHREGKLRPGRRLGLRWTRNGEPSGSIGIDAEQDVIVLRYRTRRYGETEWQDIRQRVPITWTDCALGGRRPWFSCPIYSNGCYCGRRVAKLYQAACPSLIYPTDLPATVRMCSSPGRRRDCGCEPHRRAGRRGPCGNAPPPGDAHDRSKTSSLSGRPP